MSQFINRSKLRKHSCPPMTTSPALLQSLVGGLTISIAAHTLLSLNGNIFGISGFLHRAVQGHVQDAVSLSGLILGGVVAAWSDGKGPSPLSISLPQNLLSGFLVGLGSKVPTYLSLNLNLPPKLNPSS